MRGGSLSFFIRGLLLHGGLHLFGDDAQHNGESHVRQGIAHGGVYAHQQAIGHKAHEPYHQVPGVGGHGEAVPAQKEVVGDLHGDHGGEHGADQIQKAGDIVHGEQDGPGHAHHSGDDGHRLAADLPGQGLGGDAGGPGVQERGGDGGEHQDHQGGNAQAGLDHDDGDVILAGEDGRAHADDVHPAGHQAIGNHAGHGGPDGLLGLAGIVADQGQPG